MAAREIIRMGHPTLRRVARPLEPHELRGSDLESLVEDMVETLSLAGGIGLAAPQVNESIRLAIVKVPAGPTRYGEIQAMPLTVFINPEIEVITDETAGYWEGCLSVPGLRGYVERPQGVRVRALNLQGKKFELELHGFLATVFQHEFDHLDGILYVDRLKDSSLLVFEDMLGSSQPVLED
jgi:peptide deformylase